MNRFAQILSEKYNLQLETAYAFLQQMKHTEFDKNKHIVEREGFNDNFYILRKGIVRAYFPMGELGQTLWFGYPGQVLFDVWCYRYGKPSPISIESITPTEFYYISKDELEAVCSASLPLCDLIRKILIGHAAETEESFTSLLGCDCGMERYMSLLKRHPELLQNVPLKKLASYLQLTPQSLSRIRAQLK